MAHRSGFVNIIGMPNVGKSTLINQLVGEKVAITNHKAQTTRHRILGMVNSDDYQVIFSDTPGIINDPKYPMQSAMMDFVQEAWQDADVLIFLLQVGQKLEHLASLIEKLKATTLPVYVVINKIDTSNQEELLQYMKSVSEHFEQDRIFPISALKNANVEYLFKHILEEIPEHPAYFDKEIYTDKSERFLAAELIREKIFEQFKQEIPYSVEVVVTAFKDTPERLNVAAEIYVNRKSQKGIIIGHQGSALAKIGKAARHDMKEHFGKSIYLDLYVKIKEGWREDKNQLRRFGYNSAKD
ncbi:MAG: GTPase Era [Bacteroidetes bacterium]|nr:GTPase Era [Bacteroidota bacterium]